MISVEEEVLSRVIEDLNRSGVDISTKDFNTKVQQIAHNINEGFEELRKESTQADSN